MFDLTTPVQHIEDLSVGTLQLLDKYGLATLGDVLRWQPPPDFNLFALDNIAALLEDLGHDWPA